MNIDLLKLWWYNILVGRFFVKRANQIYYFFDIVAKILRSMPYDMGENKMKIEDVKQARDRIAGVIHNVPLSYSSLFSEMSGANIYLKCENLQKTGSFKVRGAYNKITKLSQNGNLTGVIASSAGNHAQGVAYAATKLGIKSTIVMPKSAPIAKVSATKGYGAEVVLHGSCYDEAYQKATEIIESSGMTFIHPFDDEDVIAGQGTIGLEILEELPDVDVVLVPAGWWRTAFRRGVCH